MYLSVPTFSPIQFLRHNMHEKLLNSQTMDEFIFTLFIFKLHSIFNGKTVSLIEFDVVVVYPRHALLEVLKVDLFLEPFEPEL